MPAALALAPGSAQVDSERLERAAAEPRNRLTCSGNYNSDRYSRLDQITPGNAASLERQSVYQSSAFGLSWTPTPLVPDGVMYITQRPDDLRRRRQAVRDHRRRPVAVRVCAAGQSRQERTVR